jgi:hypothetical protein
LTAQVLTGLFANDDIAFTGPLFDLVSKTLSNRLTGIHHLLSNVIYALVALHVVAIGFYGYVKKQKLLKPMINGWKDGGDGESAKGGGLPVCVFAVAIAAGAVYAASGTWLPASPPAAEAETPGW